MAPDIPAEAIGAAQEILISGGTVKDMLEEVAPLFAKAERDRWARVGAPGNGPAGAQVIVRPRPDGGVMIAAARTDGPYLDLDAGEWGALTAAIRASERERIAEEIEAEAAHHLFSVRRAMRWAVWVVRGKPEHDSPALDSTGRVAPGVPCCPVETAARADERQKIAPAVRLLEDALFLRTNGERPPGAPAHDLKAETWADWEQRADLFLRARTETD